MADFHAYELRKAVSFYKVNNFLGKAYLCPQEIMSQYGDWPNKGTLFLLESPDTDTDQNLLCN